METNNQGNPNEPMAGQSTPEPVRNVPVLDKDVEENKLMAALSYLGILVIIPLLVKKDSPFVKFHAQQGIVMLVIFVIGWAIFWIPILGWLLWLGVVIVDIMALVKTLQGERWEIPFVGPLAKKINL